MPEKLQQQPSRVMNRDEGSVPGAGPSNYQQQRRDTRSLNEILRVLK